MRYIALVLLVACGASEPTAAPEAAAPEAAEAKTAEAATPAAVHDARAVSWLPLP